LAAPNGPPAAILKLANAVVEVANSGNASALAGALTDDAVIVDENPPFVWRGAGAGAAWWSVVVAVTRKAKIEHLKPVNVRIGEFKQSGSDAYLVQSMTITAIAGGKPFAEAGTMTYTFHESAGKWLISTMVWTTKP
jgi:ketosteroid isomerase-like protein